jgi:hypothetical protein
VALGRPAGVELGTLGGLGRLLGMPPGGLGGVGVELWLLLQPASSATRPTPRAMARQRRWGR